MIGTKLAHYEITAHIAPDGKQFVAMFAASEAQHQGAPQPQIRVTLNWLEELKQRVPIH